MGPLEKVWHESCRENFPTLALPEGDDPRVREAAKFLLDQGDVRQVLMWGKDLIEIIGVDFISNGDKEVSESTYQSLLSKWGEKKGSEWCRSVSVDPLYQAGCLLDSGRVDAVVAGAVSTTSDVIRAAIRCPGLKKGVGTVSSSFIMSSGQNVLLFSDCGVVIEPSSEELVDIVTNTLCLHKELFVADPKVAFVSFSTKGSANHHSIDKIRRAVEMSQKRHPDIAIDGELQVDAALVPEVAQKKSPDSPVEGKANILIFPDLNSGNIAYKVLQRLGGYEAWGPVLLGLDKPYADLSRGASVADIISSSRLALARSFPR